MLVWGEVFPNFLRVQWRRVGIGPHSREDRNLCFFLWTPEFQVPATG